MDISDVASRSRPLDGNAPLLRTQGTSCIQRSSQQSTPVRRWRARTTRADLARASGRLLARRDRCDVRARWGAAHRPRGVVRQGRRDRRHHRPPRRNARRPAARVALPGPEPHGVPIVPRLAPPRRGGFAVPAADKVASSATARSLRLQHSLPRTAAVQTNNAVRRVLERDTPSGERRSINRDRGDESNTAWSRG